LGIVNLTARDDADGHNLEPFPHSWKNRVGAPIQREDSMPEQFDLVILGAGSTAFAAALRAAESGKTVALGLLYSRFLQFSAAALSYDFAIEITTPPATMSIPP
jgi:hypothetical protein